MSKTNIRDINKFLKGKAYSYETHNNEMHKHVKISRLSLSNSCDFCQSMIVCVCVLYSIPAKTLRDI